MHHAATHRPAGSDGRTGARLDSLTSLRAFAALGVFTVHMNQLLPEHHRFLRLTLQGGSGVSFFFILSGFVLAWSARPATRARTTYRRRAARILPAYLVACLLVIPVIFIEGGDTTWVLQHSIPQFFLIQAWFPDSAYFFGGNMVTWTLAVEAVFYVLFPLIIVGARRMSNRQRLTVALLLAVLEISWQLLVWHSGTPGWFWLESVLPVVRVPEFVIGVLLSLVVRDGGLRGVRLSWTVPLALAAYVSAGFVPAPLRLCPLTLVPFALLLVAAARSDTHGSRSPLRAPWLVRLGEWSFAFYLVHELVIRVISAAVLDRQPTGGPGLVIVALVVSVALAAVLHSVVERPLDTLLRGRAKTARSKDTARSADPVRSDDTARIPGLVTPQADRPFRRREEIPRTFGVGQIPPARPRPPMGRRDVPAGRERPLLAASTGAGEGLPD